jgi:transcription termination factor Rho
MQENGGNAPPIDIPPGELVAVSGVLYVKPNGTGILVDPVNNYYVQPGDTIVPRSMVERLHLQAGLLLGGSARRTGNGLELVGLESVEGMPLEEYRDSRRPFSELISIDPNEMFKLETESERLTTRVLDLLAPVGKGQRCLIVAPPKAGKTTLLKDIAHGIHKNHPDGILFVLLVDERPEEVTDFRRSVENGEVVASSSDENAESHIHLAEIILERARRLVETNKDVVILCDSITRMSRAYNNEQRGSGKILSGGIDARTMEKPRRFFGAARNAEDWGSLTIIATALIDTGRGHLSGVQGHRQHRDRPRPRSLRAPHLPRHEHRTDRHPQGREAPAADRPAEDPHAAACAGRHRPDDRDEDAPRTAPEVPDQRRLSEEFLVGPLHVFQSFAGRLF